MDASKEVVIRFRKEKFPMPWLHGIDPHLRAKESEMAKQFEVFIVSGIPSTFLVDESGKILATMKDLRKEKLEALLKELFNDK